MLQAKHITISYGAKTVLKDVSLDFAAGSLTAIIGRNGCGKSTLLKAMSRSLIPQEGDVLLIRSADVPLLKFHGPVLLSGHKCVYNAIITTLL